MNERRKDAVQTGGMCSVFSYTYSGVIYIEHHLSFFVIMIIIISWSVNRFLENGGRCGEEAGTDLS